MKKNKKIKIYTFLIFIVIFICILLSIYYFLNKYDRLIDIIDNDYQITSKDIKINFNDNNTSNGVYEYIEYDKKILYYRGDNTLNNNVVFANYCWKIVRTTYSGGIKLVYNGEYKNNKCNETDSLSINNKKYVYNDHSDDNTYVGYMTGNIEQDNYEKTHENINSSSIKVIIDEWYKNNLIDYSNYIEDTIWCNDRTINNDNENSAYEGFTTLGYALNPTLYSVTIRSAYRTKNVTPLLECSRKEDKFTVENNEGNKELDYPIALLTLDEFALAGFTSFIDENGNEKTNFENKTNYLYIGDYQWTMTPCSMSPYKSTFVGTVNTTLTGNPVTTENVVRPAISLKNSIKVKSGDGSTNNPYVISAKKEKNKNKRF